jgi:hypothetical protein
MLLVLQSEGTPVCCWCYSRKGPQYVAGITVGRDPSMLLVLQLEGTSVFCWYYSQKGHQFVAGITVGRDPSIFSADHLVHINEWTNTISSLFFN